MVMGTLHAVALFATGTTHGRRQPVVAPRPTLPGAMGAVGPLGVAYYGYGSCRGMPIPILCQKFDPGL
jgi:hypothetical protein